MTNVIIFHKKSFFFATKVVLYYTESITSIYSGAVLGTAPPPGGTIMNRIQDMGFLILFSFFSLLYRKPDYEFVLAFLLCLCFCSIGYVTENSRRHLIVGLILISSSLLLPRLCLFFPAIFYIFFMDHLYIPVSAGGILCCYHIVSADKNRILLFLWIFLLTVLSFCLQRRTEISEKLEQKLMKLRDDSTEKNLLLSEKNRMLVEKQNSEIYAATLKERNRIAREIHDNVGHLLSRSILLTGAAKAVNKESALNSVLENLDLSLNQAMTSIRTSVHDLHDDSINLKEAVIGLTSEFQFCPVTLNYDMGYEVPKEIKYCFISIIKESLSNISRHSSATEAYITLREHPSLYQLCIKDNGKTSGSSDKMEGHVSSDSHSRGIGLSNMKDRVESLKGTLQITTDNGFRLFITIPKEQE